ncbi:MAG: hypothetical protein KDK23_11390 [Leptospiraceae bacterium]|nr:hypothetical protein [Leptospiraceae bacterium]
MKAIGYRMDLNRTQAIQAASINPDDRERSTQHSSIQGFITKPLTRKQVSEMLK